MELPKFSVKALKTLCLSLGGAIASTLLFSVGNAFAQVIYGPGDSGIAVQAIQREVGLFPDGVYGFATEDAVRRFQRANNLQVDGLAGPETLRAMGLGVYSNVGSDGSGSGGSTAIVRTPSGAGINVRNQPNGTPVAGIDDGTRITLTNRRAQAGGLEWAELSGGGWVATEYLVFSGGGGRPGLITAIPVGSQITGPYIVSVPGDSANRLALIRQVAPSARIDRSNQGNFIHAGGFSSRSDAEVLATVLRNSGLNARVTYRRYQ